MENLIYYPSFEPEDESWLKYALIYIDNFSPIIPPSGSKEISEIFKNIRDNTDLVRIVEPNSGEGYDATDKTINEIDLILSDRSAYHHVFNDPNPAATWANRDNWTSLLYAEKFTDEFFYCCETHGFGERHHKGIRLSPELCSLYMTFLAESMAYRREATPVTDEPVLDSFSTHLRMKDVSHDNVLQSAKIIVETKLPKQIEDIPLEKFIQFRNLDGIAQLRKSFNLTVEEFYESLENDFDPFSYIESIKKTNKDFVIEIGKYLGELSVMALGTFLVVKSEEPSALEIVQDIGEGVITVAGVFGVNGAWKLDQNRRNARKFLTRVGQFKIN